jgi:Tfp pilus assembly protein PilN
MTNRGLNLLPPERMRALVNSYYARLVVVGLVLFTGVTLTTGVLLFPSYVYLHDTLAAKESSLGRSGREDTAEKSLVAARTAALQSRATILANAVQGRSTSVLLRDVLAVPRIGITLVGFNYTPAAANKQGTMLISGTARSRDELHAYQLALKGAPFVASVDLPVNAYAKDTDIAFSLSISLKP